MNGVNKIFFCNNLSKKQSMPLKPRTSSLLRVIRRPMTLLKKLACSGFSGSSVSKKSTSLTKRAIFSARASVIWLTSDVINSQAIFGNLNQIINRNHSYNATQDSHSSLQAITHSSFYTSTRTMKLFWFLIRIDIYIYICLSISHVNC